MSALDRHRPWLTPPCLSPVFQVADLSAAAMVLTHIIPGAEQSSDPARSHVAMFRARQRCQRESM